MLDYKQIMAIVFSSIFHALSVLLVVMASYQFLKFIIHPQGDFITTIIDSINTYIISLAMFELGAGINKEYKFPDDDENTAKTAKIS